MKRVGKQEREEKMQMQQQAMQSQQMIEATRDEATTRGSKDSNGNSG